MTSRQATSVLTDHGGVRPGWRDRLAFAAFLPATLPALIRSLSGGSAAERRRLLARLDLPADALPNLGGWKADARLLHRLVDIVERDRPGTVLELGVGASSLVLARALERNGGGRLVGLDSNAGFVAATLTWLAEHGLAADLRHAALERSTDSWPGAFYRLDDLPERIDLLVVDGPPWTLHPLTRGAAERLFNRLPVGGTVVLDDGARPGERLIRRRWARRWPGIRWRLEGGWTAGVVVGTRHR